MTNYSSRGMGYIPPVIKALLIINVVVFILQEKVFPGLTDWGALHYWTSTRFRPHQIITTMFLHGGFSHILFNMFALWMFGSTLENFWGSKRFLNFYMICGIGASIITILSVPFTAELMVKTAGITENATEAIAVYKEEYSAIGASGAIMGVMAAFAYLFPNTEMFMMFIPIPIKAKYLIPGMVLLDLFGGMGYSGSDGVAHFAHLGGALVGLIMVIIWNKTNRKNFY